MGRHVRSLHDLPIATIVDAAPCYECQQPASLQHSHSEHLVEACLELDGVLGPGDRQRSHDSDPPAARVAGGLEAQRRAEIRLQLFGRGQHDGDLLGRSAQAPAGEQRGKYVAEVHPGKKATVIYFTASFAVVNLK